MESTNSTTSPRIAWDTIRRGFHEMMSGKMTKEEYDRLISDFRTSRHVNEFKPKDDTVNMLIREFRGHEVPAKTTHTNEITGGSQKSRLLAFLSDGNWHDTVSIMRSVYSVDGQRGICRIAGRINDLRKEGHIIESRKLESSLWQYRLKQT